jgi:hypothetical protein
VLWEEQAKGKKPTRAALMKKYKEDYTETAEKMVAQMLRYTKDKA